MGNKLNAHDSLIELIQISIALQTPIAQFMVDVYTMSALQTNMTVDEFFSKSKAMSLLKYSNVRRLLRRYLSKYFQNVYEPVVNNLNQFERDLSEDEDERVEKRLVLKLSETNPV